MTTVAVCGASLLTSIIADRLAATPSITLVAIDPTQPGAVTRLLATHPDMALIERSGGVCDPTDRLLLALLHMAGVSVVQVDAADGVRLITSRRLAVEGVEGLVGEIGRLRD